MELGQVLDPGVEVLRRHPRLEGLVLGGGRHKLPHQLGLGHVEQGLKLPQLRLDPGQNLHGDVPVRGEQQPLLGQALLRLLDMRVEYWDEPYCLTDPV